MVPIGRAKDHKYTYEDYKTWNDQGRWEIIDGEIYNMTPAPSIKHQRIVGNLFAELVFHLRGKACVPFVAPVDVVLDQFNVVQPDVFVICDKTKIKEANIAGAPDLVFEVTASMTRLRDKREKKLLYERFEVREYVIVYLEEEMVDRYRLVDGKYTAPDVVNWDEKLFLTTLPDFEISLWEIFEKQF